MTGRRDVPDRQASEDPVKTPWLGRFHGFLVTSAVLIGVAVVTSGFVVDRFFEQQQLAHEEEHTTKVVQTQARQHLTPDDFGLPDPDRERRAFAVFFRELPDVVRLKVYDPNGQVIWSDEPRLIGLTFPDNPYLARALRGEVVTVMQVPQGSEHVYERAIPHVAETYVPITVPGRSALLGVVETYKDVTQFVLGIRRTQRLIWGIGGGVGLILYIALAFVVWTASRNEQWAIRQLEAQNRELTLLHQFTRSVLQPLDLDRLAASVVESAGTGLGLARAALYRVAASTEPILLAGWPVSGPEPAPLDAVAREAAENERLVSRDGTVALPVVTGEGGKYVFVAEFTRLVTGRDLPTLRVLEIMLHETAIALTRVDLFTAIRDAHERLAAILAGIADRMVIVDRDMRVVWLNAIAAENLGPGIEALGRPCFEVLGAEGEACQACPAVRTFLSGRVEHGVRMQRLPTGEVRHLDLVTAPLRDGSGQIHQVLEVARDITELVEMEERLTQSAARLERSRRDLLAKQEELERANRSLRDAQAKLVESERLAAVGQVVVSLHHAVLNPLAGILGALQVLKQEPLPAGTRVEALTQAETKIRQIEELIRRLVTLRRAAGVPYVGDTTMLDLEPREEDAEVGRVPHT
jgi:PAS domain S-box-containing protein